MNKEEYLKKIDKYREAISLAEKLKEDLKKQFIEECCPYKVGDKVRIVTKNYRGETTEEFGFVERIKASDDGHFLPDCAACKKDGTRHARNKVYFSFDSEITKVTDEDDMRLEDYSTEQLRAELARRNKLTREAARKEGANKPKYVTTDGVIKRVLNDKGPFSHKKWEVEVSEDFANEHGIKQVLTYALLGGAFTKDTAPKVGDKVVLRCRLTKARPRFTQGQARITDINNEE